MDSKEPPRGLDDVIIIKGEIISGKSSKYQAEKVLGYGAYGKVVLCAKINTDEKVAVKVVQKKLASHAKNENSIHQILEKKLDVSKNNLVKFLECFRHRGYTCLAFELLDKSLFDLMVTRKFMPLQLSAIRVITQQILVALNALKSIGVAHRDLKPDNIMLVNHKLFPFKVKIIDFGLAIPANRMEPGQLIQAFAYRAPEVILGLPMDEGIDMWTVGCVMAFMYLGRHLYPTSCEYEVMSYMVDLLGAPENPLLDSGIRTSKFFIKDNNFPSTWRLKTKAEYGGARYLMTQQCRRNSRILTSLDDIVKTPEKARDGTVNEDRRAFVSMLKRIFHMNSRRRITPIAALGHRFITMKHLGSDTNDNDYVKSARLTVKKCQLEQSSVELIPFVTSSEVICGYDNGLTVKGNITTADNNNKPPSPPQDLIEVKTREKWFKKIKKFFSCTDCRPVTADSDSDSAHTTS